jgi:hypothetical protein
MAAEGKSSKVTHLHTGPERPTPADTDDIASLFLDPGLGDDITTAHIHSVPVGKPKDYFRTAPPAYRRRGEMYVHKVEHVIGEQYFIIAPSMKGRIDEARPVTLVTVVNREGQPRIWPIFAPREGESDNNAWISARSAARVGCDVWTKLKWKSGLYHTKDAQPGYAPDPDFSKLLPFEELVQLAFGDTGIMRDTDHFMYRELEGGPQTKADDLDAEDL